MSMRPLCDCFIQGSSFLPLEFSVYNTAQGCTVQRRARCHMRTWNSCPHCPPWLSFSRLALHSIQYMHAREMLPRLLQCVPGNPVPRMHLCKLAISMLKCSPCFLCLPPTCRLRLAYLGVAACFTDLIHLSTIFISNVY